MEKVFVFDSVSGEPVFTQFRHNAKGAIKALMEAGGGVAIAALYHPDVGDIDLRWGHTSDDDRAKGMGLAKLIRWHPEVMNDLQGFISSLKARPQKHKRKNEIHLSDGKDGRAGIKMIWNGETSHWLVTAYIKPSTDKKNVSASKGIPASLDDALEPTTATSSNADGPILGFECHEVNPVMDDVGSVTDVAAMMARAKLTKELRGLKAQIMALGKDPISMIKSARLAEQLRKIRKELGVGAPVPPEVKKAERPTVTRFVIKDDGISTEIEWQESTPGGWGRLTGFQSLQLAKESAASQGYDAEAIPVFKSDWNPSSKRFNPAVPVDEKTPEPDQVKTLREVAAGQHDTKGLPELFGLIQEAVNGLDEAGLLTGDADGVANDAITHWAELEERLSANV